MSNKNVLILMFFSFCSFISFIFVGFQFTKIWIFTLTVQILFDSLENRIPQVNSEVTLLPLQGDYSMVLLTRGDADRSAPSWLLLGLQPEDIEKKNNSVMSWSYLVGK